MIVNENLRIKETSSTAATTRITITIITVTTITTNSKIGSKKPSRLILLPMDILEIIPCVKDAPTLHRKDIMRIGAQKQTTGPQESILRDELAFIHFRISTLETTLEDTQLSLESSLI
ncbi:hypothetical protein Tco_0876971 [Tanacetum coccineum]|uniref:Uncharacterized protein n=1 Tax=Tanacetum coccineum TaxID=301880 RepID=A0ABQ5BTS6_9ASTR